MFSRKKYSCQPKKASKKLELSTISSLGYQYQNSYFKISGIWVFEQKSNILIWLIPKPYIFTKYTESQKNVWKWHEFLREFELFELFELFEYLTEKYSIFDLQLFLFELETLEATVFLCMFILLYMYIHKISFFLIYQDEKEVLMYVIVNIKVHKT